MADHLTPAGTLVGPVLTPAKVSLGNQGYRSLDGITTRDEWVTFLLWAAEAGRLRLVDETDVLARVYRLYLDDSGVAIGTAVLTDTELVAYESYNDSGSFRIDQLEQRHITLDEGYRWEDIINRDGFFSTPQ